ncbi:MAG: DUF5677 domain-containing protein [Candidatus Dadabacteria bacterium]|nr:DUF5677 domain-containing protein [Candidatus Dadabacteria bacterium]MDE0520211.1 DUF5677 domain-containing protein [Candidatus Dadabacteria bacterium]MDE0662548.1 DUF5677 domain-containing protein [Candidatus Dadabacteria bacterium]
MAKEPPIHRPVADLAPLKNDIQNILNLTRGFIEKASEINWEPGNGRLATVCRTILRRQFDSLRLISQLVEDGEGFITGSFLRLMCEEFIWSKYLAEISLPDADSLIGCIGIDEVYKCLSTQDETMGRSETEKLGLLPYLEKFQNEKNDSRKEMHQLGEKLNWPDPKRIPSTLWLAEKVGEKSTYELVYRATSRFVHFSPMELARLVTEREPGKFSIEPAHLNLYRGSFSLYWGSLFFVCTVGLAIESPNTLKISDELVKELDYKSILEIIGERGMPPIIGIWELAPPEQWQN